MTPTKLLIGQILIVFAIVILGSLGCAAAMAGSLWRARQAGLVTTHGSARWASLREVEAAGLLGDRGVFLGRLAGRYLRHDGPEHVMAFAPTRSGKGVGLMVPTRLGWTGHGQCDVAVLWQLLPRSGGGDGAVSIELLFVGRLVVLTRRQLKSHLAASQDASKSGKSARRQTAPARSRAREIVHAHPEKSHCGKLGRFWDG